ncbi:hypothetical protein PM082_015085 [Marasmius tenuissimus]|nr:hypothetical protein PM082_015085 [Marasmius tenuissimus]
MSGRQQRVMVQPINVIFKNLQQVRPLTDRKIPPIHADIAPSIQRSKVIIWLYDNIEMRIEGRIIGFDEFMNVVIDEAAEVFVKEAKPRRELGMTE